MFAPPQVGEVVLGRYRIEGPLGAGGMGVVLRATHLGLNQAVALKFLAPSVLSPEIATERFLREAQATFRLRSEHTVRVLDAGTLPNGAPVMVMELLEGQDLKAYIAQHGPLSPTDAVEFAVQACDALAEAHALGIVHRDLKAPNLFVSRRVNGTPTIKVLDFGISKIADSAGGPLTMPDTAMGSPRYMAPEQWQSASTVDARADIYALGAVIYEMLTGKIPLASLTLEELIKRIAAGSIPSPKELRPDLPDSLCRVVLKALRPFPDERYPTAMHFAAALRGATPAGMPARPRPNFAHTAATAVVDRELLLARARLASAMPSPSSAPDTDEQLSSTADDIPALSSTLNEGRPVTEPLAEANGGHEAVFDDMTAVSAGNPSAPPRRDFAATLQVAQSPPGIMAKLQAPASLSLRQAAPPSVLAMGLRDAVRAGSANATVALQVVQPQPPAPPAPMQQPPAYPPPAMQHGASYGPPPRPRPAPLLARGPSPVPARRAGSSWWVVLLVAVVLFGLGLGVGMLVLLRR